MSIESKMKQPGSFYDVFKESQPRHPQEQPMYAGWYVSLAAGIDFMARRGHEGSVILWGRQLEESEPEAGLSTHFYESIRTSFDHSVASFDTTLKCTVQALEALPEHYTVWHPYNNYFPGRPATVIRSKLIKDIGPGGTSS